MQYQGGKSRLAKYIVPILESHRRGRPFVEPFCGGCSITARMTGERYASDLHRGLITMWQAVQNGWKPPTELSREEWYSLREANDHDNPLTAFAEFGCSFAGKSWGGYASSTGVESYAPQTARSISRKARTLQGVQFNHASVFDLRPVDALVYCDPPYAATTGYRVNTNGFDHERFWQWCRDAASRGCAVFVSEYSAPTDAIEVWSIARKSTTRLDRGTPAVDRLFRLG